jgi:hypothetical protein
MMKFMMNFGSNRRDQLLVVLIIFFLVIHLIIIFLSRKIIKLIIVLNSITSHNIRTYKVIKPYHQLCLNNINFIFCLPDIISNIILFTVLNSIKK